MLTPGRWLQNHAFWNGFFNPTYWPSLIVRSGMAVVLAGMFGLITGLRVASPVRERVVRYAGAWVLLGIAFLVLPVRWYFASFPPEAKAYFDIVLPAMRHIVDLGMMAAAFAFLLAAVFAVAKPSWLRAPVVALILLCGFTIMGTGEYTREVARKPYAIGSYIYSNDLRLANLPHYNADGFVSSARWIDRSDPAAIAEGKQVFAMPVRNLSQHKRLSRDDAARPWMERGVRHGCRPASSADACAHAELRRQRA